MSEAFEKFQRLLSSAVNNVSRAFYDQYVEANAKFRTKSGLKAIIIREELGECCSWCADLAGIYDYDNAPKDVWGRHENCKCSVIFKSQKGNYQDAWSKNEFQKYKDARIAREKEILSEQKYALTRKQAKVHGKKCYDATEEWNARTAKTSIKTKNAEKKYWEQYEKIEFKTTDYEKEIGKLIVDTFGGTVRFLPEVKKPEKIQMADFLYRGEKWDLKTPEGKSKNSLYNICHKNIGQANNFIIDLKKAQYTYEEAIDQAEKLFYRKGTKFVNKLIIINDGKIKKVFERI